MTTSRRILSTAALIGMLLIALPAADAAKGPAVSVTAANPKPVARAHWTAVKVRIANRTGTPMSGLVLAVKPARGVAASVVGARKGALQRAVPAIRAHRSVTIVVRLHPGRNAAVRSVSTVSVTRRGRLKARRGIPVTVRVSRPAPAIPANPLVGRYFYTTYLVGATMYYRTYYFASDRFAYKGRPSGGLPACSTGATAGVSDGCIPYTYDTATGTVTVDGMTGSETRPHLLKLNGVGYAEAVPPAVGATFATTVHNLQGAGLCGTSCVFSTSTISFTAAGYFAYTSTVSGSTPDGGFSYLPAEQHGTYRVLSGGRLELTFASGQVQVRTIVLMLNRADQPDPAYAMLLDGAIYWGPGSGV